MGVSKRIAEMAVKHMNAITGTRFIVVRFGNVLGSSDGKDTEEFFNQLIELQVCALSGDKDQIMEKGHEFI